MAGVKVFSSNPATRKKQVYYTWQLVAAILGLAASLYLSVQHTRLKLGIQEGKSFCSLGGYADCDVVNNSQFAEVLGFPLSTLGALFFSFLLLLGILFPPEDKNFAFGQKILGGLTLLALFIDFIPLLGVQLFVLKTFCLVCLFTYLATLSHLYLNTKLACAKGNLIEKVMEIVRNPASFQKKQVSTPRLVLSLVFLLMFSVILFLLPSFIKSESSDYLLIDSTVEKFFLTWKDKPQKKLPVDPTDGTYGNPNAKIQVVEFSDFECPFCRKMAFQIHTLLPAFKEKVHFVFKHYPLDTNCNPKLTYQMHAHACKLARLASCSTRENAFWDFHDLLFLNMTDEDVRSGWDEIEKRILKIIPKDRLDACLKDPKSLEAVSINVTLGNQLELQGTPTIYINGKEVSIPKSPENLKKLIQLESEI